MECRGPTSLQFGEGGARDPCIAVLPGLSVRFDSRNPCTARERSPGHHQPSTT